MSRSRKSTVLTALAVVVLVLSSCSPDPGPAPGPEPTPSGASTAAGEATAAAGANAGEVEVDPDAAVSPVWRRPLDLLTQPVVAGGTAIVLVRARRDEIDVVGVRVRDGRVRWRHPFSPGTPSGYGLGVDLVSDSAGRERVVFQRPGAGARLGGDAPLVAVDPATGQVVRRSDPVTLLDGVRECDGRHDGCVVLQGPFGRIDRQFMLATGRLAPFSDGVPDGGRLLGDGLYDDGDRPDDGLVRAADGELVWQRPAASVFGRAYTSDAGWEIHLDEQEQVYWGYLGWRTPSGARFTFEGEAGARQSIRIRQLTGFSARTGRRLWRMEQVMPVSACQADTPVTDTDVEVACWFRGDLDVRSGRRWFIEEAGLLGFDPRTGKVRWRVSAGRTDLLRFIPPARPGVTGDHGFLRTPRGALVVDYTDGSTQRLDRRALLLCAGTDAALDYAGAGRRTGDALLGACRADGSPARRVTRRAVDLGAVHAARGWRLVGGPDGLTAYRS